MVSSRVIQLSRQAAAAGAPLVVYIEASTTLWTGIYMDLGKISVDSFENRFGLNLLGIVKR